MRRDQLAPAVRRTLVRYPEPYRAHYGVVPMAPPAGPVDITGVEVALESASRAMGQAEGIAQALPAHFVLSRILVRQEAVSSSAIEGTNATLDELLVVEETADEDARAEARQVRDYAVALEVMLAEATRRGGEVFTLPMVQDLHRGLMRSDAGYPDTPGDLRQGVVWIGPTGQDISRSTFNPPPPDLVQACLAENLAYMRCDRDEQLAQHLVTRMAIAHAHFESVHPFRDGNGRVGRLLLPLMMAAEGATPLYLSPYLRAETPGYFAALKDAQQRLDYRPLISVLSAAIVAAVAEADTDRAALGDLMETWRQRRAFREGSASARAVAFLVGHPVVDVNRLAERLGVSFTAANRAVEQLVDAGILELRRQQRRNRLFVATEVLGIYNRRRP
ncbi:MAG: Fic family protein [Hyphomicrobiaceae bacterium]